MITMPKITDAQFDELERNICDAINYQFRQITDTNLTFEAQQRVASFVNDLISAETFEA